MNPSTGNLDQENPLIAGIDPLRLTADPPLRETVIEELAYDPARGDRVVLTYPAVLSREAIERIRESWNRWEADRKAGPLVLESGMRIAILRPLAPDRASNQPA